ncbi:MAG: PIN domain-containing protein [Chloroflexi bacterium]|nr:PIN domain-containing protein [Chloroflexota bacterium]
MADRLFDTTVFIDYFRGDATVREHVEPVIEGRRSASFSVITEAELWVSLRNQRETDQCAALLSLMERATMDGDIAREAGAMRRRHQQRGVTLPDAIIAATAKLRGEPILTKNRRHLEPFASEVKVETY